MTDSSCAPDCYGGVAVFADDVTVNVLRIDSTVGAEQRAKACGVEGGAGAEHTPCGTPCFCREPCGEVRHDIDRVGRDDDDRVRSVLQH